MIFDWVYFSFFVLLANPIGELATLGFSLERLSNYLANRMLSVKSKYPVKIQLLLLKSVFNILIIGGALSFYTFLRPVTLTKYPSLMINAISISLYSYGTFIYLNDFTFHPVTFTLKKLYLKKNPGITFIAFLKDFLQKTSSSPFRLYPVDHEHAVDQVYISNEYMVKTSRSPLELAFLTPVPIDYDTIVSCIEATYRRNINGEEIQYMNVRFKNAEFEFTTTVSSGVLHDHLLPTLNSMGIRFNSNESIDATVFQQFIAVWKSEIAKNGYIQDTERVNCMACSEKEANIFIKSCPCTKAMWCDGCLAQWWLLAKKSKNIPPEDWLLGTSACPICRKPYAIKDLRYVE